MSKDTLVHGTHTHSQQITHHGGRCARSTHTHTLSHTASRSPTMGVVVHGTHTHSHTQLADHPPWGSLCTEHTRMPPAALFWRRGAQTGSYGQSSTASHVCEQASMVGNTWVRWTVAVFYAQIQRSCVVWPVASSHNCAIKVHRKMSCVTVVVVVSVVEYKHTTIMCRMASGVVTQLRKLRCCEMFCVTVVVVVSVVEYKHTTIMCRVGQIRIRIIFSLSSSFY